MSNKKKRFIDGVQLVDNLYKDPRNRPNYFSYRRPDGSKKTFQAKSVEEANKIATFNNEQRDKHVKVVNGKTTLSGFHTAYYIDPYIEWHEDNFPKDIPKDSWHNRKNDLKNFAKEFPDLNAITFGRINEWFSKQTNSTQKRKQPTLFKFFNFMPINYDGKGLCPHLKYNPFTRSDDRKRLIKRQEPDKKRPTCKQEHLRTIHSKAGKIGYLGLQIALEITSYTGLRRSDVVKLRFDTHIVDGALQVIINKSEAKLGFVRGAKKQWILERHPILKDTINRARRLSLQNFRCPYIASHKPKLRKLGESKTHFCQMIPDLVTDQMKDTADECGLSGIVFHEVRGLAATMYYATHEEKEVQEAMAHEDVKTTRKYVDPEALRFTSVEMKLEKAPWSVQ